jgi:hypothetical protein
VVISKARIADVDDAFGKSVHSLQIVRAAILQLHDPIETFGAVAGAKNRMLELNSFCNLWKLIQVHSRPERRYYGTVHLAPPGSIHELPTRESEPFFAAIITFEITSRIKWDEGPAGLKCSHQLG